MSQANFNGPYNPQPEDQPVPPPPQQYQPPYSPHPQKPQKNYIAALLLSVFVGGLGVDRMYLGHWGLGVTKLLLSWITFGVWWLIDVVLIATRKVNNDDFVWDDEVNQPPYYQAPPQTQYNPPPNYPQQ